MQNKFVTRRDLLASAVAGSFLTVTGSSRSSFAEQSDVRLVQPELGLVDWKFRGDKKRVNWTAANIDGIPALKVEATGGVGFLHRDLAMRDLTRPVFRWRWRVDALPESADLTRDDADDIPAGIALIFGETSLLRKAPPMLIYAWAGEANRAGEVITCLRHPQSMRFVVMRSGLAETGRWHTERRNVLDDYQKAFGEPPQVGVKSVALWCDSDQTGGESSAAFGNASLSLT